MKVVGEGRFGRLLAVRLCRWVLWRWSRVESQSSVVFLVWASKTLRPTRSDPYY
ncbi:hypothetical protein PAJL_1391 [Cutibacterium acnes HL042PA3]|nr:hypothetical protein HMPREF9206_0920 [Cutibacterium acnes J139]EFT09825.1 hypothetical protein HMPREF9619_01680 [Cutibacterium acnes HL082PA2]EFT63154.1 hypothetical protein HMPREF9578_00812 [Cutibacterium acnes HL110PA4]EFT66382.1 hypothetical protein HMPREF9582_00375 [Cutibacterium acnes HL060PA1]ESK59378.1 hypothetical protein PAJL_1391 [Cutibacterium acnes HL042PA3]